MMYVQVERYPRYVYDEEAESETDELEGWTVFSTIHIDEHTVVRAVVDNEAGEPADAEMSEWFVEWRMKSPYVSCRITGGMDRGSAVEIGKHAAPILAANVHRRPMTFPDDVNFLTALARTVPGSMWEGDSS